MVLDDVAVSLGMLWGLPYDCRDDVLKGAVNDEMRA